MNRRLVLIIIMVVVFGITAVVTLLLSANNRPVSAPEILPSKSPTAFASNHPEAFDAHQAEAGNNPLLTKLPYGNRHFYLTFGVSSGEKYAVEARVNYIEGREQPETKFRQQEPFIIAYFRSIGQPDGTYVIQYVGNPVQDMTNWR